MTTKAIVIGASMAGLAAARVLSDHVDEVLVVERDDQLDDVTPRRGVPQGRHAHAILAAGLQQIEGWYPGITDELVAKGAVTGDGGEAVWYQAGAFKVQARSGVQGVSMSRPLLEGTVRQRLLNRPNVSMRSGASVDSLRIEGATVKGIVVDGELILADLVVDCSGRSSRFIDELSAAGFAAPKVSSVKMDMAYATRLLSRRDDDIDGPFMIVAPTPPFENRLAVLLPIEGQRWILTLAGFHGDVCPTDDEGWLTFARSLPTPHIAEIIERADVLSPVMTHRLATNQRRHFERLRRVPAGFLVLGDAVCSFNPIYGQGMSSAALQAAALDRCLRRHRAGTVALASTFYAHAAKVVNNPWQIAAGSDFLHPMTTGPKPPGTDFINRYVAKVQLATHVSPEVLTQMVKVQNLLAPPPSLMKPSMMLKVRRAAKQSPAKLGVKVDVAVPVSA